MGISPSCRAAGRGGTKWTARWCCLLLPFLSSHWIRYLNSVCLRFPFFGALQVVWITGASRGIGEVLSMQFASLGAKLILSARNKEELERVKRNIISKHPDSKVEVLPMDLSSDEESLKEVVHSAESLFSSAGIDYMMHNAAFERPKRGALEETEEGLKVCEPSFTLFFISLLTT
uniref:Dehydrogenase/reductase SDR family member 7 n=1 Tax=Aegilops tauschii subsp. strangulata TaxID=200361 RepID=A0A453HFW1_AEGTS